MCPLGIEWENTLGISQVSHDFLGVFGSNETKDNRYNLSEACNVDINAPQEYHIQSKRDRSAD